MRCGEKCVSLLSQTGADDAVTQWMIEHLLSYYYDVARAN